MWLRDGRTHDQVRVMDAAAKGGIECAREAQFLAGSSTAHLKLSNNAVHRKTAPSWLHAFPVAEPWTASEVLRALDRESLSRQPAPHFHDYQEASASSSAGQTALDFVRELSDGDASEVLIGGRVDDKRSLPPLLLIRHLQLLSLSYNEGV